MRLANTKYVRLRLSVCLCVCLSVCSLWALTSDSLDLETSFLVSKYIFTIPRSSLFVKVIGSKSMSREQKTQGHRSREFGDHSPLRIC